MVAVADGAEFESHAAVVAAGIGEATAVAADTVDVAAAAAGIGGGGGCFVDFVGGVAAAAARAWGVFDAFERMKYSEETQHD